MISLDYRTGMRDYNQNKFLTICFCIGYVLMLAVSAIPAHAEPSSGVKSVVRTDAKTGRLVRRVVAPAKAKAAPATVNTIVKEQAEKHAVDPLLVHSVIQVESGYNPVAVSPKGAQGLMQLIPATARRFGVENAFDAEENIEAGVKYLKYLKDLFQDDKLALAAYNAGEGAVLRHKGVPPYRETQEYVKRVAEKYGEARKIAESEKSTAAPAAAEKEPHARGLEVAVDADGRIYLKTR